MKSVLMQGSWTRMSIAMIVVLFQAISTSNIPVSAFSASATVTQATDPYSQIILATDSRIRPTQNQSAAVEVSISASILSLLAVDEVRQSITLNLLIRLTWIDEIRRWNPDNFGGLSFVDITASDIWIPKLLNGNSVSKRDTFGEDYAPLSLAFTGKVIHLPGGIMHTGCSLDMTYYPFDSQICTVELISGSALAFLQFVPYSTEMEKSSYIENPEWRLLNTTLIIKVVQGASVAEFEILIQRKPSHFILTVLVPINIVSGLSSLVFLMPIESGERMSFSVTILLALSVYTSEVAKGLPNNSETVPLMVIYLACLLLHAATGIIANLILLMKHHSKKQINIQSPSSGRLKNSKNDCRDFDFISLSEGPFPYFDNADGSKLGQREESQNNTNTRVPDAFAVEKSPSSSTHGGSWRVSLSCIFAAFARKFNYGERDFRSTLAYKRSQQVDHMARNTLLYQTLLTWLLQFVETIDFVVFSAFLSAWLTITVVFMAMFNQG